MNLKNLKNKIRKNLNEKRLFIKIKRKDREAFIDAYDMYADQIFRFICFKVNSQEDAKDLTSAVFLKAWDYIKNYSISEYKTLRALLYKIARNIVIDYYRKSSNEKKNIAIDDDNINLDLPDDSQDIVKEIDIKIDFKNIINQMQKLKDEYREVIVLKYINELSVSEIAKILDKSTGNVRVLSYRAINALRELINEKEEIDN